MGSLTNFDWVGMGLKVLAAIAILILTAILASVVKSAIAKIATRIKVLQRPGVDAASLGNSLGSIASLLIWLLGLVVLLGIFQLDGVLSPVTDMLSTLLGYLPNVIGAGFVFFIGLMIAKIVKSLIVTGLGVVDLSKVLGSAKSGVSKVTGDAAPWSQPAQPAGGFDGTPAERTEAEGPNIPEIIGNVVFAVIMIVVSIASLQILGIASISRPAEQMLTTLFTAIPNIIAALVLLAIGVAIARFASSLLKQILDGAGLDSSLRRMDLLPEGSSATPVVTRIVEIAIVLFFAVMSAQVLGFPQITAILSQVLELGGSIIFGAAIIAAGFFIANILEKLLSGQAATIVKYVTIILFVAIGLKSMGVADSIIEMAFGALVIGAAAAAVLAFGLGGRETASRVLAGLEKKSAEAPTTPTAPAPSGEHPEQG